ncbi:MAG: GNAT family N-acetyltransferase [Bacteroidia bacterium]|nr:GNAT family N-acetyltransferase [Bacteroidia bacterium]
MRAKIISYLPEHQADFKRINEAWISKYFKMEIEDFKALDHPQEKILKPGGAILLAELEGKIVGTCALIKMEEEGIYELAKMGVDESARGHGLGYMLGQATIEKAREMGAKRLYLETNSVLTPAITLYHKLGFKDVEGFPTPYARCDVQMILDL